MASNNIINLPLPITTLGTVTSGTWNASVIGGTYGGTGVNNGASTITIGGSVTFSGAFTFAGTLTGNTSVTFPTSGTLATTSQVMTWTEVTGTSQTIAAANGYVANNAGLITFTLPASGTLGDVFEIVGLGGGGWKIAQNANQIIRIGNVVTTTGVAGSVSSSNQYDCIRCVCIVAGASTAWTVASAVGNLTYV